MREEKEEKEEEEYPLKHKKKRVSFRFDIDSGFRFGLLSHFPDASFLLILIFVSITVKFNLRVSSKKWRCTGLSAMTETMKKSYQAKMKKKKKRLEEKIQWSIARAHPLIS